MRRIDRFQVRIAIGSNRVMGAGAEKRGQHAEHEMKRVSSEREPTSDERDYERIVVAELRRRLPEGEGIKSCEGFKHLGVQCRDTCHNFYRHDEMSVIDLPDGGKGRVCDPVKWAIYPEEY